MSKVSVGIAYKKNTGNFENITFDFGVQDESRAGETTDEAFERVYKFVERKLVEKLTKAEKELG